MPSKDVEFWLKRSLKHSQADAPGAPGADDLRPFAEYSDHLRRAQEESGKPGLVLGATARIIDWCRNNNLRVTMMDFCEPLTQALRSSHKDWDGLEIAIDDWLSTTRLSGSFCWAAGDGVVNAVGSGRDAVRLMQQIHRLLLPGSLVILRNLLRPFPTPKTAEIFAKLRAGRIHSFSAFRHQLLQSLQPSFMDGSPTRAAYDVILKSGLLNDGLKERLCWPEEPDLDYYAVAGAALCYPTLSELRALTNAGFEELSISHGDYEMYELSPTIICRTRIKNQL